MLAVTGGTTVVLTVSVKKKIESTVTVEMQNSENWFGIQKQMSCSTGVTVTANSHSTRTSPRAGWPAVRGLAGTRPGGAARLAAMRISRHAALHRGRVRAAALANTGVPEGHGSSASGVERSDPGERGD